MLVRLSVAALLTAMLCMPVSAQWSAQQKREFMGDCVEECEKNPNIKTKDQKDKCPNYCGCVMSEGQKRWSSADYTRLDADARANRDTEDLKQFSQLFPTCSRRTWQ